MNKPKRPFTNQSKTYRLAAIAVFTALTAVTTMLIHIPIPGTAGYINIGDSMIFITAALLGPLAACFAGGVGSAIADLILAPVWAPFTLVIKAIEGLIAGLIMQIFYKKSRSLRVRAAASVLSMSTASVWMAFGYGAAAWILYGNFAAALAQVLYDFIQGGINIAIGFLVLLLIRFGSHKLFAPYLARFQKDRPNKNQMPSSEPAGSAPTAKKADSLVEPAPDTDVEPDHD